MGLDAVELVLAVEDCFQIQISDQAAGAMYTVDDLYRFVLAELEKHPPPGMPADIAWDLLRNLICMELGVRPDQVVPAARFVQDLGVD